MLIVEPLPGEPDVEVILTPATLPCKACSTRAGLRSSIVSDPTTLTAPVISFLD